MATEPVVKRIIGIDPGYAITGYGIIDKQGNIHPLDWQHADDINSLIDTIDKLNK